MALGKALTDARIAAGLSIEDVAAATRVRNAVIAGIEAENFRLCGGDVYARGHIRAIARAVGVVADPLIEEFDSQFAEAPVTAAEVFEAERSTVRERRGMNWSLAMVAGIVSVVGIAVTSWVTGGSDSPGDVAGPTPTQASSPSPTAPAEPVDEATPQSTGIEADASGVVVQMSFSGSSWIRISSADQVVFEGIERAGSVRTFRAADSLSVVVGNAGAVRMVVNGDDRGIAGRPGQVLRETFTR
jgi:cytoskeleton protein RodZ